VSHGSMLSFLFDSGDGFGWTRGMIAVTRALLASLDLPQGARILEVGCGGGALLEALHRDRPDFAFVGLDPSALALLAATHGSNSLLQGALPDLPFAGQPFDAVLALDVIDQNGVTLAPALESIGSVLHSSGVVVVRVSAYPWLYGPHDKAFNTGRRFYTSEMVRALVHAGFRPLRVTHANALLAAPVIALRIADRLLRAASPVELYASPLASLFVDSALQLEALWLRRLPLPLGLSLIVVAQKREHKAGGRNTLSSVP
jgi:SAM-dependent methyltransferase